MENVELVWADESPIYLAEFVVSHDCWSRGLKTPMLDQGRREVPIDIVYEVTPKPELRRVRFSLGKLAREDVMGVLRNGIKSNVIKKAKVWMNGGTTFELLVEDISLNTMLSVEKYPFGEVLVYSVVMDNDIPHEFYRVYVPSLEDMKAREIIRRLEDELNECGEASLEKFERIDEYEIMPELRDYLPNLKSMLSMFKPEEVKVLATALEKGYFDVPKTATLDDLAAELNMPRTRINEQLRNVTRKISKIFIDELRRFYMED